MLDEIMGPDIRKPETNCTLLSNLLLKKEQFTGGKDTDVLGLLFGSEVVVCAGQCDGQGNQVADSTYVVYSWQWEPSAEAFLQSGKLHPEFLILALSKLSTNLIHHLPDKKLLGNILLPGNSSVKKPGEPSTLHKTANIYTCTSCLSLIIVSVQYLVPEEGAYLWTKTLFQSIQPERVLILGLTPIYHFRGKLSSDEPSFFLLETDHQKREEKADLIYSQREEAGEDKPVAPYYPSGSLVDGLAAAVLTHCQLRGLRGRLLLTWPAEDSRMAQMLAAALTNVLRLIPQGSGVKFLDAVKLLGKKPLSFNNLYI